MKQKLRLFAIHQTATNLQWTDNLNPRTRWYPVLDESNRTKSASHNSSRVKIRLLKVVASWNPFFLESTGFHILHFPNSTGLFTKPTGHHYTKHRFSPDIAPIVGSMVLSSAPGQVHGTHDFIQVDWNSPALFGKYLMQQLASPKFILYICFLSWFISNKIK
jgi:hypothetical protein